MFSTVLLNVSLLLFYMLLGLILCKTGKATAEHAKSMSGYLIYILGPFMIVNSFLQIEYSHENLKNILLFFVLTLFIQTLFFIILYILFSKKYEDAKYRILSLGGVLGNVGYFGMPVVRGIFPNDPIVNCYSSVNVLSMNLLVFTIGVFLLTGDKKYISLRSAVLNPTTLSAFVGIPLFIFSPTLPLVVSNSISLLAGMVTPMCMLILGIRLSTVSPRLLFGRGFVYLTCLFKLIIFPIFAFILVRWLPFLDNVAKISVFVLAAAPSGAIIESLAELHEREQELAANVVLLTTISSIVTMPLILMILMKFI